MFGIGTPEIIIIVVVALLVFGPSKLPELGKTLGKGIREFKKASTDLKEQVNPLNEDKYDNPPELVPDKKISKKPAKKRVRKTSSSKTVATVKRPTATAGRKPKSRAVKQKSE